jgi:ABC-type lipoprotein export system ATPase subunit
MTLLQLDHINKTFSAPTGSHEITVLKDLSLVVEGGDTIAVAGPSGSGKTTLLNIIGTLDKPTSGSVVFNGQDLVGLDESQLARMRNREIGFIFQLHHLLPQCTVLENVLVPTIPTASRKQHAQNRQRAVQLLTRVGLDNRLSYFPAQLSGGELQRVAVVRAFINHPRLLLADEPTGSLDLEASQRLGQLLVQMNREEQTTLVVVTHSTSLARLMNKVYRLEKGKLIGPDPQP